MSVETDKRASRIGDRRSKRTHVLRALVASCLMLWGVKVIQHAMQPKHQGMTAQEWFAAIQVEGSSDSQMSIMDDDPALEAFRHFGPPAAKFLWQELQQRDPEWKSEFIRLAHESTDGAWNIERSDARNFKAQLALRRMGTAADCLIPELLTCAQSTNQTDAYRGLSILSYIGTQAEVVVPFLLSNLTSTNPAVFGQSMQGLNAYGSKATTALPALEQGLTLRTGHDRLLIAYAMIGIGDRSKLAVLLAEIENIHSPFRTNALSLLMRLKTNAVPAVPALLVVARNSTNDLSMQKFTVHTIEVISPGAAEAEGLR